MLKYWIHGQSRVLGLRTQLSNIFDENRNFSDTIIRSEVSIFQFVFCISIFSFDFLFPTSVQPNSISLLNIVFGLCCLNFDSKQIEYRFKFVNNSHGFCWKTVSDNRMFATRLHRRIDTKSLLSFSVKHSSANSSTRFNQNEWIDTNGKYLRLNYTISNSCDFAVSFALGKVNSALFRRDHGLWQFIFFVSNFVWLGFLHLDRMRRFVVDVGVDFDSARATCFGFGEIKPQKSSNNEYISKNMYSLHSEMHSLSEQHLIPYFFINWYKNFELWTRVICRFFGAG